MRVLITLLVLGLAANSAALARKPPARLPPCNDKQHHQFDFWLGEWIVHGGPHGDRILGHNTIRRSDNGCWLSENWHSAGGNHGTSVNSWDNRSKVWRQFWVGADGGVLRLKGGLRDGSMVMEGELPGSDGGVQRQRIAWTPQSDGSVIQRWTTSDDEGKTWQVSFRGVYRHPVD